MKIDRRTLLRLLLATPVAALCDVEHLLWVPKPFIIVPALPTPPQFLFQPKYYEVSVPVYLEDSVWGSSLQQAIEESLR